MVPWLIGRFFGAPQQAHDKEIFVQRMSGTHKKKRQYLHTIFETIVLLKGINGLIEIASGVLVLRVSTITLNTMFLSLARNELFEDSHDFFIGFLSTHLQALSNNTKTFVAFYILAHGVLNIFLAVQLYRRKQWAYGVAIAFALLFIIYQAYRLTRTHSMMLLAITIVDLFFVFLAWRERRIVTTRALHDHAQR